MPDNPFGGCEYVIEAGNVGELAMWVRWLGGECSWTHRHNVCVEYDGPGGKPRLWCSEEAIKCLKKKGAYLG